MVAPPSSAFQLTTSNAVTIAMYEPPCPAMWGPSQPGLRRRAAR